VVAHVLHHRRDLQLVARGLRGGEVVGEGGERDPCLGDLLRQLARVVAGPAVAVAVDLAALAGALAGMDIAATAAATARMAMRRMCLGVMRANLRPPAHRRHR
jgi:hypothetical protein